MKHYPYPLIVLILGLFTLTSCPGNEGEPAEPEKGFVKGKVVDTQGNPLPGVEIVIDNTYLSNSNVLGTTDQKGNYAIQLPNAASTYQAYAKLRKTYNGKRYDLDLHPDNTEGFTQSGAVRNFQWKLTGKKPVPLAGIYGGMIQLDEAVTSTLFDVENIAFTLVPVGPLIDGSTGKTLTLKSGLPTTETYSQLSDIPIGRYTISAIHQSEAGEKIIQLRNRATPGSAFANSIQVDFAPQTSFCFNCVEIEYKE